MASKYPNPPNQDQLTANDFQAFSDAMGLIYGRMWEKQFETPKGEPNPSALTVWMLFLNQKNITKDALERVLSKTIDKHPNFAPRLPQIVEMCRLTEEDLGLPTLDEAYREATSGRLSHRPKGLHRVEPSVRYWSWAQQTHLAIYHATQSLNLYAFDRATSQESFKMFKEAWAKVLSQLVKGEQLEPVPKVLEQG